jgi:CheY-like chemotaxis protein
VTHKLLLADDSVTIQRVVELTFSGEDVHVVTVGDGEQAIARIPVELPDIVLADIGMPKRSGYDVAAFVKGRSDLWHIPVLLLAGAFEPVDEMRAQQVRSDGVLVKPFEPQQVISRVRDLIQSSRSGSSRPPAAMPEAPNRAAEYRARNGEPRDIAQPAASISEPQPPRVESRGGDSKLDDYFDRLDAAFAELGNEVGRGSTPHSLSDEEQDNRAVPTLESLLAVSSPQPEESGPSAASTEVESGGFDPAPQQAAPPSSSSVLKERAEPVDGRNLVADMFAALFAVEQGEAVTSGAPFPASRSLATAAVTDTLVDEVTRRVLERLAPDAANELVAQIVSEVAERLIREEITRIKAAAAARL